MQFSQPITTNPDSEPASVDELQAIVSNLKNQKASEEKQIATEL